MNSLLSQCRSFCRSNACLRRRYYTKVAHKKSGSSSRKLAKTLEPKESGRGHLEIAPRQSTEKKTSSTSSNSFVREEAPHTTRIPAPLWNKRRPVERVSRWSSDRRREPERSFRDRGGERDRMSERYSQERRFGDRQAGREPERSFRDRGVESDRVSERYSQERRFGDRQVGRESEKSFRGGERDKVSERHSQEQTSGGREAGKKVSESENDTRHLAYKQYLERRDSRSSARPDSPPHSKSISPNGRRHDNETTTDEFHHPLDPVSLAPSSKSKSKVLAPDAPFAENFTSPPLLPGLLKSLKEMVGDDARPTPIQSLSLKWLLKHPDSSSTTQLPKIDTATTGQWRQFLLASETGSGKSIAYLLPLLQNLKEAELMSSSRSSISGSEKRPYNPRGLILAPTHELARQLSGFAKFLLHEIKLRVLCTSQANQKNTTRRDLTASKMSSSFSDVSGGPLGEFEVGKSSHPVDILVGTPMKVLEMVHGRGWDRKEEDDKELQAGVEEENAVKKPRRGRDKMVGFGKWRSKPELGLANIEWVVVDEADVLFDPDFQETTRTLLADISSARGHLLPVLPSTELSSVGSQLSTPVTPDPINYPFNLLLTSATIPNSLNLYLERHHPSLVRLASPLLHHLPKTLQTEYVSWTGGNKFADVERRIRQVWAEDSANASLTSLSKILVFCNRSNKVLEMSEYLNERGIKNVAMTSQSENRGRGSNKHLAGFLRTDDDDKHQDTALATKSSTSVKDSAHVMITTSLLSRGLDFSPLIKHVFIVDEPRNMIDFLHRAGRSGRAGQSGKVVMFGKMTGRGSSKLADVRKRVSALRS